MNPVDENEDDGQEMPSNPRWYIGEEETLEMWSERINVNDMLEMYRDPVSTFYSRDRMPGTESDLYKEHSLAGLRDEFRFQDARVIKRIFEEAGFQFTYARRTLVQRMNNRKTRRPDKDVGYPPQPCIAFVMEKRFCQLEEEITFQRERKRLLRELDILESGSANELLECSICLSVDCLPAEMASCQSGHRFCRMCVTAMAEEVLATGRGKMRCLANCEMVVEEAQLRKVLIPNILYKLLANQCVEKMTAGQVKKLARCPFCPYFTLVAKKNDKLLNCLNPLCSKVSCKICKLSNHSPLSCKKINGSRKKVEEKLTMARVRQCWNCKLSFERVSGCPEMTCPSCQATTCYICRKNFDFHYDCQRENYLNELRGTTTAEVHKEEVRKAAKKIKGDLTESEMVAMEDLFKPGPSNK